MGPSAKTSADYREPSSAAAPAGGPASDEETELADGVVEEGMECRCAAIGPDLHGQRLDKALVALAPEFSRSHLQQLLARGHVQLDAQVQGSASRRVRVGQSLRLELQPTAQSQAYRPQAMELQVVFEDDHLLVLNKPAGLVVHPGPGNWQGTLLNGLLARDPQAASLPRAGIVHRLDKDTSGLMMVGRSLPAVTALVRQIAAREVHRRYLALTHGVPTPAAFTVDAPIGRDPRVRVRMAVVPVSAGGRVARTHVRLLARAGGIGGLSCTLETGRTHQIRVHLAHRGLPLLADALYGGAPALGLRRQALHATELRLVHPVGGDPLHFECAPPADFEAAWAQLQACPGA